MDAHHVMAATSRPSRALSSEPTLPRRDSMEDADSTLMRKRPRLDRDRQVTRSMSADEISRVPAAGRPSDLTASQPDPAGSEEGVRDLKQDAGHSCMGQSNSVTINVRLRALSFERNCPQDPSASLVSQASKEPSSRTALDEALEVHQGRRQELIREADPALKSPMRSTQSPDVEIEALGAEEDDEDQTTSVINVDGQEESLARYFLERFPFADRFSAIGAAGAIKDHFEKDIPIQGGIITMLTNWFEEQLQHLPKHRSEWRILYCEQSELWDEIGLMMSKFAIRRASFGDEFSLEYNEDEETAVVRLLSSYVKVCCRLMQTDADLLEQTSDDNEAKPHLVSSKNLKALSTIFRFSCEVPLWSLLRKFYHSDVEGIWLAIVQAFAAPPANGMHHLSRLASQAAERMRAFPVFNSIILYSLRIAEQASLLVIRTYSRLNMSGAPSPTWLRLRQDSVQIFRATRVNVEESVSKQTHSASLEFSRELIALPGSLLASIAQLHDELAFELATDFLRSPEKFDREHYPVLIANSWKFQMLKRYISKGRMELRVFGIETMNSELVAIWKQYNSSAQGVEHPVMQFLAHFLLEEKMIDYIIGVDSHPQLISRSGNIVGFLVVTQRYTQKETDTIWATVSRSQDPRVVAATLSMLSTIANLMQMSDLIYFTEKLYELHLQAFDMEMLKFAHEILERITMKPQEWARSTNRMSPFELCIRLIEQTSPTEVQSSESRVVYDEVSKDLRHLAHLAGNPEDRLKIYHLCAEDLDSKSTCTASRLHAMYLLLKVRSAQEDLDYLMEQFDLMKLVVQELCAFVRNLQVNGKINTDSDAIITALSARLDIFFYIIHYRPLSLPNELEDTLWNHLVGVNALGTAARNIAWQRLAALTESQDTRHPFLDRCISRHFARLDRSMFTAGLYDFANQVAEYEMRVSASSQIAEGSAVEIPGADMLWRIVLWAPDGSIEYSAAQLLAHLYMNNSLVKRVPLSSIEATHVALVESSMRQLAAAMSSLTGTAVTDPRDGHERSLMQGQAIETDNRDMIELRFVRTLMFLSVLVQLVRSRPELTTARTTRIPLSVPSTTMKGEVVKIYYQAFNGVQTEMRIFEMGDLETVKDLRDRLASLTGFSDFFVISGGQILDLSGILTETVRDAGIGTRGALLVKKRPNSRQHEHDIQMRSSAVEREVTRHFDQLYEFMATESHLSKATYDFLSMFSSHEQARRLVASEDISAAELFPSGQPYKTRYSILSLTAHLRGQLSEGSLDEKFILRGVQLLDSALRNGELIQLSITDQNTLSLAVMVVECLFCFLQERPPQRLSASYFARPAALVERLVGLAFTALSLAEMDGSSLALNCYKTLLESSLHCREVWTCLTSIENSVELHDMLLTSSNENLRNHILQTIASVLGGLPSSSSISLTDLASFLWQMIATIIPGCIRKPETCGQVFSLAVHVLRLNDTLNQDESILRSYLLTWSNLLLQHSHDEVVGRSDVDEVVLGLTRLLTCCVQFLRSFKKPLLSEQLMEEIFKTFLFPPLSTGSIERKPDRGYMMPVLDSQTRKELYELVFGLCENVKAYQRLLKLMSDVTPQDNDLKVLAYDRARDIRSPHGYLGIRNLSNTCYMNSLLTQLYMNVPFRDFILRIELTDEDGSQRLLAETQRLFARMQESYDKAVNARDFAASMRTIDNQLIDVTVQMDVDEFYNLLFDQWESQMESQQVKETFRGFYGGKTVTQIKSMECEHVSERIEGFIAIPCVVKGKSTLHGSLKSFVEGDVMEGDNKYKCESCKGEFVDAVKRTCLKEVPDNLIFHLKRFDFDLVSMQRNKINDRFDFPMKIDVSPYKVDSLDYSGYGAGVDMFDLVGILVHMGTAESGHYFSYVRSRSEIPGTSAQWLEFNDADVTEFDPAKIADLGFGGWIENGEQPGPEYNGSILPKPWNAYMLFYQRSSSASIPDGAAGVPGSKAGIPRMIASEIACENERRLREYCLFDQCHTEFVRNLLQQLRALGKGICTEDHDIERHAICLGLEHVHHVVSRTKDVPELGIMMALLKRITKACARCSHVALSWIARHSFALRNLLLRSPVPKVRSEFGHLIVHSLRTIRDEDADLYGFDTSEPEFESDAIERIDTGAFPAIVEALKQLNSQLSLFARAWDDYFGVLCQICSFGAHEVAYVLHKGFLLNCLEILVIHYDPLVKQKNLQLWRCVDRRKPPHNRITELVSILLTRVDMNEAAVETIDERLELFNTRTQQFPMLQAERGLFMLWDSREKHNVIVARTLDTWDMSKGDHFHPGDILATILRAEPTLGLSTDLCTTIHDGIEALFPQYVEPYVKAAVNFCTSCPLIPEVMKVITTVIKSPSQVEGQLGQAHLDFFREIVCVRNEHLSAAESDSFFYYLTIERSTEWAPPLLMYEDNEVRMATVEFLSSLLFQFAPIVSEPSMGELKRSAAVRHLLIDCAEKIKLAYGNDVDRRRVQALIDILRNGARWFERICEGNETIAADLAQPGDAELVANFRELLASLESWPVQDDDLAVSEEWASDYGSESEDAGDTC